MICWLDWLREKDGSNIIHCRLLKGQKEQNHKFSPPFQGGDFFFRRKIKGVVGCGFARLVNHPALRAPLLEKEGKSFIQLKNVR